MSDTRSLGVNIGANTNSFTQGIAEVQARLTAYNRALLENREATRQNNAEIRNLERQQAAMRAAMQEAGGATEEERQNLASLQNSLDAARDRAAELATQQATLRTQIRQTTTELVNASTAAQNATNRTEEQLTATERLQRTISQQETELRRLEQQYSDTVLEENRNSVSAQNLRQQIERLSSEINGNRERLEDATYQVNENSDALDENSEAAENASEGFTILKGAISSLVADAIQQAIDKFKELMLAGDKALNKLQAQTGMTNAEISEFKSEMYDLYRNNYGGSLEDIAGTMSIVKQSFSDMNASQVEEITRKAIIMSDTFGSDVEETLRGVNALMTHMGLTADEAFDYIAKGSQNGLDKTHELSDNLAEYTQIWAQAGFTADEMFSVLQNGIDSGAYNLDKVNDLVKEISISIIDGRFVRQYKQFFKCNKTSLL